MNHLILFTDQESVRCHYIASFLFEKVLGLKLHFSTNKQSFHQSHFIKLNYSNQNLPCDLQIVPHQIIFEKNIQQIPIQVADFKGLPCFFKTSDNPIPFDILGASFYLLSRYEEYLPHKKDQYGRFAIEQSLAYKHHFLQIPLIDQWMQVLKKQIIQTHQNAIFQTPTFQFHPTYDIDMAYSYRGKSFFKNLIGFGRDLIQGKINQCHNRLNVLFKNKKDPFDSFNYLDELHTKFKLNPIYFFLLSQGGKLDKNIPPTRKIMQILIKHTQSKYQVGIHPSMSSHKKISILQKEIQHIKTNKSRQHYIHFTLPKTFQNLIQLGISNDYSMGYGSSNGFRASTSFSHQWFDLSKNKVCDLTLHPFCFMECNSFYEQHHTAQQASEEMLDYYQKIKKVNGQYIMIWHNFSLGDESIWQGWQAAYHQFLTTISFK
jgi:hypothetical protein